MFSKKDNEKVAELFELVKDRNNKYKESENPEELTATWETVWIIIGSLQETREELSEQETEMLDLILLKGRNDYKIHIILGDELKALQLLRYDTWYRENVSVGNGIWIGNGIQDQYFGTEIEMTGITRQRAAEKVAELFGTRAVCDGGYYGVWSVTDQEGKKWKFMYDGSIYTERRERGRMVRAGSEYSTEMVSPKLSYGEMGKLQEVVRCLRHHGAKVNASCGQHVHVDASNHTPRSLKNAMTIMYSKEDILFKALKVQTSREQEYCQKVRPMVVEKIRRMPNSTISMEKLKRVWYEGRDGSNSHYDSTRYYALNLHAVFSKGTLEWRCFESTLHAGKVRANITLALAISAQAINQKCTQMRKTEITENPAFTFRTFLLRLGLIGPEYKNVREHLLANLEGDRAWRYDRSTYECLNRNHRAEDAR